MQNACCSGSTAVRSVCTLVFGQCGHWCSVSVDTGVRSVWTLVFGQCTQMHQCLEKSSCNSHSGNKHGVHIHGHSLS